MAGQGPLFAVDESRTATASPSAEPLDKTTINNMFSRVPEPYFYAACGLKTDNRKQDTI